MQNSVENTCNKEKESISIQKIPFYTVLVSVFLAVLDYAIINIALPVIAKDLHATASVSIWVVNAYQILNCMFLLPLASMAERFGARRVCLSGLSILVFGSVLCSISYNIWFLIMARAIQGVGGAAIMAVNTALIRSVCPVSKLGQGLALNALVTSLAVAIGPSVAAGILYFTSTWRWLFLVNLPLGLLAFLLCAIFLPKNTILKNNLDILSILLNLLAFGLSLIGGDFLLRQEWSVGGVVMLAVGLAACTGLYVRQKRLYTPLLPLDLLENQKFFIGILTCFLGYTAANFFMISIPFSLVTLFHRTVVSAGILITPWPVSMVLAGPVVAFLSQKIAAQYLVLLGLLLNGFGFLLVRVTPMGAGDLNIMWRLAIAGVGFALFVSPNNKITLLASPLQRSASASGMISLARILGQTCGASCVALLLTTRIVQPTLICLDFAVAVAWSAGFLVLFNSFNRRE